jgi:hypothetical protein
MRWSWENPRTCSRLRGSADGTSPDRRRLLSSASTRVGRGTAGSPRDDQQSPAIALGSPLLVGNATLWADLGRVAALRETQHSSDARLALRWRVSAPGVAPLSLVVHGRRLVWGRRRASFWRISRPASRRGAALLSCLAGIAAVDCRAARLIARVCDASVRPPLTRSICWAVAEGRPPTAPRVRSVEREGWCSASQPTEGTRPEQPNSNATASRRCGDGISAITLTVTRKVISLRY